MKKLLKILLAIALAPAPSMAVISCYKAKPKDNIHEELIDDSNIYDDIEEVINNLHQINKHLEVIDLVMDLLDDQDQIREEKEQQIMKDIQDELDRISGDQDQIREEKELKEEIESITNDIHQDF